MLESYNFYNPDFTDLNIYQCGIEDCTSGYSFGPAVRDHFLLHFILDGVGVYQVGDKTHFLSKGQGFLICPDVITRYQADCENPWSYAWVGFNGLKAEMYLKHAKLSRSNLIFNFKDMAFVRNCFEQMNLSNTLKKGRDARLHGYLYILLSGLLEDCGDGRFLEGSDSIQELYVKKAIEYIKMNYSRKISVSEIALYIGIGRGYLCKLFKSHLCRSPQDFLINFRIEKACELMNNSSLSIGDISRSIGYEDPLAFSKVFKKSKGISPINFKSNKV